VYDDEQLGLLLRATTASLSTRRDVLSAFDDSSVPNSIEIKDTGAAIVVTRKRTPNAILEVEIEREEYFGKFPSARSSTSVKATYQAPI
jgi:hypothetical protein